MVTDAEPWGDFAVAAAGASAALAGLLFVAISINLRTIVDSPRIPGRAAHALILLATPIFLSLAVLIPQGPVALGVELLVAAAVVGPTLGWLSTPGHRPPHTPLVAWVVAVALPAALVSVGTLLAGIGVLTTSRGRARVVPRRRGGGAARRAVQRLGAAGRDHALIGLRCVPDTGGWLDRGEFGGAGRGPSSDGAASPCDGCGGCGPGGCPAGRVRGRSGAGATAAGDDGGRAGLVVGTLPRPCAQVLPTAYERLAASADSLDPAAGFPRSVERGATTWTTEPVRGWTVGFFAGELWLARGPHRRPGLGRPRAALDRADRLAGDAHRHPRPRVRRGVQLRLRAARDRERRRRGGHRGPLAGHAVLAGGEGRSRAGTPTPSPSPTSRSTAAARGGSR